MTATEDLVVTIDVDTTSAMEAFARAVEACSRFMVEMAPVLWRLSLADQRRRSRLVTRNKQRRNW